MTVNTIDSLHILEPEALIDSVELNENFKYLEDKADNIATNLDTYVDGQIETLSGNCVKTSGNQTVAGTKTFSSSPVLPTAGASDNSTKGATTAHVKNVLGANGGFVTTYVNSGGTYWYREYFSNAAKTTRIWLEQGGLTSTTTGIATKTINFASKNFSNKNYFFLTSGDARTVTKSTSKVVVEVAWGNGGAGVYEQLYWYACGK